MTDQPTDGVDRMAEARILRQAYAKRGALYFTDEDGQTKIGFLPVFAWVVDELERLRRLPYELLGEVERLRSLLRRLEWSGFDLSEMPACPACGCVVETDRHAPDCWLAAEL